MACFDRGLSSLSGPPCRPSRFRARVRPPGWSRPARHARPEDRRDMMYFSRLKTTLVLAVCILGVVFSVPNLFSAPAAWLPWRTIHLGLDLRGGSYLLMQGDMSTVIRERLDGLADSARSGLRQAGVPQFVVTPDAAQNRLVVKLPDPSKQGAALAALQQLATQS